MSKSFDSINVPEQTKQYLTSSINLLLEDLVTELLIHQPSDPALFLYEHLQRRCGIHDKHLVEIERLKV